MLRRIGWLGCSLGLLILLGTNSCVQQHPDQVIVFCSLDRAFSESQLQGFTEQTKIVVQPKYDTESTKTVGLANQILEQADRGVCDVFWNNEILHTLRLEREGKLVPFEFAEAENFPAEFRSATGHWYGLAARARVLIVNTKLLPDPAQYPTSIQDLVDPKWRGQACLAKPLFGTTATHFAVLHQSWGTDRLTEFVAQMRANEVGVLSGNRQVAADVAAGKYAWGWTDTDDFHVEKLDGSPVALVYPDQADGGLGCLLLPNTIAIIKGGKNPQHAQAMLKHVLAGPVEEALARSPSAQFPLDRRVAARSPLLPEDNVRWMNVDWEKTVEAWDVAGPLLQKAFY
ncbi:MAG: extracellular solute-binding protein [Planctomycetaceae bacterium]|nr:extracellular solute-binding protein [Planctomycetaceae bacterium]